MTQISGPARFPVQDGSLAAHQIDTARPSPARMYDYYLGGKDNYQVDRDAAEAALSVFPQLRDGALANRLWLGRVVRHLLASGVDQFLDIGAGIPSKGNSREVAHGINPDSRVVYVDNDPVVLVHGHALLDQYGRGRTVIVPGDVREPQFFLGHPDLTETLDLTRPVGVLLVALMHFVQDEHDPYGIVREIMDAVPSGSYLALSHASADREPEGAQATTDAYKGATAQVTTRTPEQIAQFFHGLDLVEPGVTRQPWWWPDGPVSADEDANWLWCGLAVKP